MKALFQSGSEFEASWLRFMSGLVHMMKTSLLGCKNPFMCVAQNVFLLLCFTVERSVSFQLSMTPTNIPLVASVL